MKERVNRGNSPTSNKNIRRVRKKMNTRKSVFKMLAVMEASQNVGATSSANAAPPTPESATNAQEFLSTGRTGRRNALPDILSQHSVQVSSSDLPQKLQALSTNDTDDPKNAPSTSKS